MNPIGSPTTVYFQWGPTTSYGRATVPQSLGNGLDAISVFADITGLSAGTLYHFRVVASNGQGTTQGSDLTFVTPPNTYTTWAAIYGLGGPLEDPEGDGMANIVEFAFGINPTLVDRSLIPRPQIIGSNMVLSFAQSPGVSGITYGAEWSATLQSGDWHTIPDTGTAPQHVFSIPIGSNPRLFLRLRVTEQ